MLLYSRGNEIHRRRPGMHDKIDMFVADSVRLV